MRIKREKERNRFMSAGRIALCLFLFMTVCPLHVNAVSGPVYKEARPEKDLAKEKKGEGAYRYDPEGKVDPFVPFIKREEIKPVAGRGREASPYGLRDELAALWGRQEIDTIEPLERFELSELTVTAIIKKHGKIKAMVRDPKGRGYIIEEGTRIGKNLGRVHEIISKTERGPMGITWVRKVIVKEPVDVRGKKVEYKFVEMKLPFSKAY